MPFWDLFRFKRKPFKEPKEIQKTDLPAGEARQNVIKEEGKTIALSPQLNNVLVQPYLSEKSTILAEQGKFVFEVDPQATKKQIAEAIRSVYGVKPIQVAIAGIKGKAIRYGRTTGQTKTRKKAIITLPKDKKIDIYK